MNSTLIKNSPKRRAKLVIMAEIVGLAKKGTSKTNIMVKANLSFSQVNHYLELLSQAGLLETSSINRRVIYMATEKGLEFMERQFQIMDLLNEDRHEKSVKTLFEYNAFSRSKSIIY